MRDRVAAIDFPLSQLVQCAILIEQLAISQPVLGSMKEFDSGHRCLKHNSTRSKTSGAEGKTLSEGVDSFGNRNLKVRERGTGVTPLKQKEPIPVAMRAVHGERANFAVIVLFCIDASDSEKRRIFQNFFR